LCLGEVIYYFKPFTISANSSAFKEAPPTSPPSTSFLPKISFALFAFTLPPYKIEIDSATSLQFHLTFKIILVSNLYSYFECNENSV